MSFKSVIFMLDSVFQRCAKMKKITAFIFDLSKGGAQGVFVTVMNAFCKYGYSVDVVVQNFNDPVQQNKLDKKIPIYSLNSFSAKDSFLKLYRYVKTTPIECAWVFGPEMAVNVYFAKILNKKLFPIVGRCLNTLSVEFSFSNSIFRKYITNNIIKFFFHNVDFVIAQSHNMAEDLERNYYFKKKQIIVINNALSIDFEKQLMDNSFCKKENYILFVGRLEQQKGLRMLIKAFSSLSNNIKLFIAGEGSEKQSLMQYSEYLGVKDRIFFLGYRANTVQLYREARCVVLSSYFEGFPNVLIESLACGTPVVSFDCPSGPSEIIVSNINGFLVDYCNIEKLSFFIDKALKRDWDRIKIKETAKNYKLKNIIEKYLNVMNLL